MNSKRTTTTLKRDTFHSESPAEATEYFARLRSRDNRNRDEMDHLTGAVERFVAKTQPSQQLKVKAKPAIAKVRDTTSAKNTVVMIGVPRQSGNGKQKIVDLNFAGPGGRVQVGAHATASTKVVVVKKKNISPTILVKAAKPKSAVPVKHR